MELNEAQRQSVAIRMRYHELERQIHGSEWTAEEDALAFLTDAGLVGRLVMDEEGRWPSSGDDTLPGKIGECVWWLAVLADRTGLSLDECVTDFLAERQHHLGVEDAS
ncbi:MAG: hypothetical protein LKK35_06480 [Olsenella sp.]|nr:hypothetical protein [Olsenella sp.]MCH3956099.1 hypothetical protein [Olsenella sp.]MCI1667038.1 hypothetical protein [Olsenella sp.]MCI2159969.1 hypothetical protein [Olsenella sp.]MCI2187153.1 hypothetical protein [Olsenella sp.]